ncbi:MAG TPA: ABC transporter permease [bacterium]|nr:ABC transporter permease [bacterium]
MRLLDIIRISITNLRGNKMRSALTILGIAVGIATIVFLVSLGYGLQDLSVKRVASIEAVTTVNVSAGKVAAPDKAFVEKYKTDPRIEKVVVVNSVPIKASLDSKVLDGVASIVPTDFFNLEGLKPDAGAFYGANETKGVVISSGLAKGLNVASSSAVDKSLAIKLFVRNKNSAVTTIEENLEVIGTYLDDSTVAAYITPDLLEKTGELDVSQVKLKVGKREDLVPFKNEIENAGYGVASVADTIGQLDSVFRIIQIVLAVFGGVALIVASIGMFNTMTIALLERTRDVGIMKATGTEDKSVYLIFLSEAILISASGGVVGLALGWLTSSFVNLTINTLARSVGGEPVDLFLTPVVFVVLMLGFSFLVGVSTGFLPARRAAKLNPLEALRYE